MNKTILCIIFLLAGVASAKVITEHDCKSVKTNSPIAGLRIKFISGFGPSKYYLETYDHRDNLMQSWEVEYGDDMTYIGYYSEREGIYFNRDWPVKNDEGPGRLEIGDWSTPHSAKIYDFNCTSPRNR